MFRIVRGKTPRRRGVGLSLISLSIAVLVDTSSLCDPASGNKKDFPKRAVFTAARWLDRVGKLARDDSARPRLCMPVVAMESQLNSGRGRRSRIEFKRPLRKSPALRTSYRAPRFEP